MTAPTADATRERDIDELYEALMMFPTVDRWEWAKADPIAAADELGLRGAVRVAFLTVVAAPGGRA